MKKHLLTMLLAFGSVALFAQTTVKGKIVDSETGEALIGATVVQKGTGNGAITNMNGGFSLTVEENATLSISYVGYKPIEINSNDDLSRITLEVSEFGLKEIEVLASVAIDRKTPVAVSTIRKEVILEKASNQEFPELLKSTPGVYATKQGGGYGDSRVNLRGFNSENVAVLINGVPVNDMENGRVFWSNWAGLTDVTTSMQVQRGLGASKVAVPSIGGTINILTQNTDAQEGGNIFFGIGNNNYQKSSFYVSTGLSDDGWALSFAGAKITGDGFVDGTQFIGYNYFFNMSKILNDKHSLSLTGFGAPQSHGQRQSRKTIEEIRNSERDIRLNTDYGFLDGELTSVEDNFYHKPQFSLNHYWTINDKMDLSTAAYVSFGTGGGGGSGGSLLRRGDGLYDLEGTRQANFDNNIPNGGDGNATGFLRASRNDHKWYGVLSTLDNKINSNLSVQGGIDLRYYRGIHFTDLTNQLGADYVLDDSDINAPNRQTRLGDKIFYNNDGIVLWQGLFGQVEYNKDDLSVFGSVSLSNTSFKRVDYFQYFSDDTKARIDANAALRDFYIARQDGDTQAERETNFNDLFAQNQETEFQNFLGYQIKGGANYRLTKNHNVFVNAGFFTKAPDFTNVFLDFSNEINEEVELQKIVSFEVGYGYRSANFNANINAYRTNWNDRTFVERFQIGDTLYTANLLGVDALHQGIELDFAYQVNSLITINGMASFGDWTWANDLTDIKIFNENQVEVAEVDLYISGLKVGNAAQTTAALGFDVKLFDGFKVGLNANYYANNYADYNPNDRGDESQIGVQPWQIPDYVNVDLDFNYKFKVGNNDAVFYGNVNNLLNEDYITDANDGSASTVLVYYGTGTQWTAGLRLKF
jgi:iron complex outermembrane recepter protein